MFTLPTKRVAVVHHLPPSLLTTGHRTEGHFTRRIMCDRSFSGRGPSAGSKTMDVSPHDQSSLVTITECQWGISL